MKDDNKYVFPCGDKFSAIDVGYCQGVKVATIANGSINWGTEKCANCKLANFREFYTGGETNLVCLAYSEEYLKNKEETDKVLKDGWFNTGDLARIDKDGYIFICGRKKSVIVLKNGKNFETDKVISALKSGSERAMISCTFER